MTIFNIHFTQVQAKVEGTIWAVLSTILPNILYAVAKSLMTLFNVSVESFLW